MGTDSRYRLAVWAVLALVILNLGLMGLLWFERYRQPSPPPQGGRAGAEELFGRELQLDQRQTDSVRVLRRDHFLRTDPIRAKMVHLSMGMMDQLFAPAPDTALVRQLSEQIGREQAEFERCVYEHFNDIKGLLRPDQYDKLRQLIIDGLRKKLPQASASDDVRQSPEEQGVDRRDDRRPPPPDNGRPPKPDDRRPVPSNVNGRPPGE